MDIDTPTTRVLPPYPGEPQSQEPPPGQPGSQIAAGRGTLLLVALIATVIGAGVATGMTLLVANTGPQGNRGVQGPRGEVGPRGPAGDTADAEAAIADLSATVDDLQARVDEIESNSPASAIDELQRRLGYLEGQANGLCAELGIFC